MPGTSPSGFSTNLRDSLYEVRRADAASMDDPFVHVSITDIPDFHPPQTRIVVNGGMQQYENYDQTGDMSARSVGNIVRAEVVTGLVGDSRKVEAAERIASLVFDFSAET